MKNNNIMKKWLSIHNNENNNMKNNNSNNEKVMKILKIY